MGRFAENAARIFEAAEAIGDGGEATDLAILISETGTIRMISQAEQSDWPLAGLRAEHGATMAYRVTRNGSDVHLEGCADQRSCRLQAPTAVTLKALLSFVPQYSFT